MNNGDEEIIKNNKLERANMCMARYFNQTELQKKGEDHMYEVILNGLLDDAKL